MMSCWQGLQDIYNPQERKLLIDRKVRQTEETVNENHPKLMFTGGSARQHFAVM